MTAAEQARAEVEAWWDEYVCHSEYGITDYDGRNEAFADLAARLTPVFERAEEADTEADRVVELAGERDALRERAERAEAELLRIMREQEGDGKLSLSHQLARAEAERDEARRERDAAEARYMSAVHGRAEFRNALREEREKMGKLVIVSDKAEGDEMLDNALVVIKERDALRADVARLREACLQIAGDWHQLGEVSDASARRCSEALAATEPRK